MLAVTKGALYVCMKSSTLHTLYRAFTEAGGHWSTFVIWAKNTFTMGRSSPGVRVGMVVEYWRTPRGWRRYARKGI
jgi:hypothetical protein